MPQRDPNKDQPSVASMDPSTARRLGQRIPGSVWNPSPGPSVPQVPIGNREPYMTALVLGGGGSKGAFQVGVLKYLYERQRLNPAIITGTSVGALNAAKLAEGPDAISELVRLWRGIRGDSDVYVGSQELGDLLDEIDRLKDEFKSEIGKGLIASYLLPFWLPLSDDDPFGTLLPGQWFINPPDIFGELKPYLNRIKGLCDQQPLINLINTNLNEDRIASSGIYLRVATVARDKGILRYVNEYGDLESPDGRILIKGRFNGGEPDAPSVIDGVIASAAIPLVFQPKRIAGVEYWDGAIREDVPVHKALQLGATDLTIVLTSPRKYKPGSLATLPSGINVNPVEYIMRAMDIMADEVFQNDLSSVLTVLDVLHELGWNSIQASMGRVNSFPLPRDPQSGLPFTIPTYKVIEPPFTLGEITSFEPEIIEANIELGEIVASFVYPLPDEDRLPNEDEKRIAITRWLMNKIESFGSTCSNDQQRLEQLQSMWERRTELGNSQVLKEALGRAGRTVEYGACYWKERFEAKLREYNGDRPLPLLVVEHPA